MQRHKWYAQKALGTMRSVICYPVNVTTKPALEALNNLPIDVVYVTGELKPSLTALYALESTEIYMLANKLLLTRAKDIYILQDVLVSKLDQSIPMNPYADDFVNIVAENYRLPKPTTPPSVPAIYVADPDYIGIVKQFIAKARITHVVIVPSSMVDKFDGYPVIVDTPVNRMLAVQRASAIVVAQDEMTYDVTLQQECKLFDVPCTNINNIAMGA